MRARRRCRARAAHAVAVLVLRTPLQAQSPPSPFDLSIEELGELCVTTVSRRSEPRREAAAPVFVITAEDIRRSGVTSIPEALRLAPGVEVAGNGARARVNLRANAYWAEESAMIRGDFTLCSNAARSCT